MSGAADPPFFGGLSATMASVVINRLASYGNYVKLKPNTSYVVTVRVRTAESPLPVEARFQYRQY